MTCTRRFAVLLILLLAMTAGVLTPLAQRRAPAPPQPGYLGEGVTLLPNGWKISPAGRHLEAGDLPLAMVQSPDRRYLIITNNGWAKPTLTIVDLKNLYVKERIPLDNAWLGLAWHPDGTRLYSSGASQNIVEEFRYAEGKFTRAGIFTIARPQEPAGERNLRNAGFVGGLAVHPNGETLYAVQVFGKAVTALDTGSGRVRGTAMLEAEPYSCLVTPDGRFLIVSLWGGAKVLWFDAATLAPAGEVAVGGHPNSMVFSKDATRLFVACANTNAVWVVDMATKTAREQISIALYPNAPPGSTPNAVALSPEGDTLLVANADNNTVAVVDVETPGKSQVDGFIPTGWYPTAVMFDTDGQRLFVLSGKGLTSSANPRGPQPGLAAGDVQYSGRMLEGALSVISTPDVASLKAYTERVYALTPYTDVRKLAPPEAPKASPIPRKVGDPSPIKHVFYIIRENRTYDQVLGDIPHANGDPNLTLFGDDVTPNAHAIVGDFVVFDNFYVDAEISYDGHAFSTGAYATDVVEKMWPTNSGGRGGPYLSEGGWENRTPYGNFSAPPDGYIWDFAVRAGVTVRSYGEFATWEKKGGPVTAAVPGLEGRVHPSYPPYDPSIPDNERVDIWLEEFRQFEANGQLPALSIIRLPNDHTSGTRPGAPTPQAMVAENDQALGRIVEAVSKSPYWRESAILVLEDDAQNGPDHVDAHRSVLLVASPFARRRAVDSTLYTTSGVLRTIELILGLPPMSQYDASATPMYNAFQPTPVLTAFTALPPRVPLDEKNDARAFGAQASLAMDLEEADVAPELELNEIIWKSIRGADSPMPPPVRTGFIRSIDGKD